MSDEKQMTTTKPGRELTPFEARLNDFRGWLFQFGKQLRAALPKHMDEKRMQRIIFTTVTKTPKLLDCDRASLMNAIVQAAQLGLEPDGMIGHAYLVPYKGKVQLIPGYKGLIELAYRSGRVLNIEAHVVRVGDKWIHRKGTRPRLIHRPASPPIIEVDKIGKVPDPNWEPGAVTQVYCIAKLRNGVTKFEVMDLWEINRIMQRSEGYRYAVANKTNNPWITDWDEMAKKTVVRRACKMLPASVEMQTAVALDERADAGLDQELNGVVIDVDMGAAAEGTAEGRPLEAEATQVQPEEKPLDKLARAAKEKREGKDAAP